MSFDPNPTDTTHVPYPPVAHYPVQQPYGAPVPAPYLAQQYIAVTPPQGGKGLGITGMVLGIVAAVLFWVPILDLLLGILATVFGSIGLFVAIKRNVAKGFAISGLVLGVVVIVWSVLYWAALAASASA